MNRNNNKTGAEWSKELNLILENHRQGWRDLEEFNGVLLSKIEFLNRASISKFKIPDMNINSRRAATQFKSILNNKQPNANKK